LFKFTVHLLGITKKNNKLDLCELLTLETETQYVTYFGNQPPKTDYILDIYKMYKKKSYSKRSSLSLLFY
jgi:hypothetical protein